MERNKWIDINYATIKSAELNSVFWYLDSYKNLYFFRDLCNQSYEKIVFAHEIWLRFGDSRIRENFRDAKRCGPVSQRISLRGGFRRRLIIKVKSQVSGNVIARKIWERFVPSPWKATTIKYFTSCHGSRVRISSTNSRLLDQFSRLTSSSTLVARNNRRKYWLKSHMAASQ